MPKISVIVPVYKVEAYLDRCVESVVNQTFENFELILVDDGSPDNCGAMCDAWAAKDSRIHVIHQKNGGLSAARNAGLEWVFRQGEGQWITFLDSDDWLQPNMLEWMLRAAEEGHTDVSVCAYENTGGEDPWEQETYRAESWTAGDFYQQKFINATIACGKLYAKHCFESHRFPVGKLHEDEFTTYRVLFEAEKIAFLPMPLYAYYVNPNGITKTGWSPRRLDAWEAYEQQIAFFQQRGLGELVKFRYAGYLENALVNLAAAEEAPEKYAKEITFMKKRIRSVIRRAWKQGCLDFRLDFDILCRFYPLTTRLYRLYLEKLR